MMVSGIRAGRDCLNCVIHILILWLESQRKTLWNELCPVLSSGPPQFRCLVSLGWQGKREPGLTDRQRAMTVTHLDEALNLLAAEISSHLSVNCFKVGI